MLTWPQNARNPISKDVNVKYILGGGYPRTPLQGTSYGSPFLKAPFLKSYIHPR